MGRRIAKVLVFSTLLLVFSPLLSQEGGHILFERGYSSLVKGDFKNALGYFKELESDNTLSPQLFYDMGIAYYELKNYPESLLYFEKARFLSPFYRDNNFNLKQVNSILVKNFPLELKVNTGVKGWIEWLGNFPISLAIWVLTFAFILLLLVMIVAVFNPEWRWALLTVIVFIIWFVLLLITWEKIKYDTTPMGVVLNKIEMHSAPGNTSKITVELPGGVKFQVMKVTPDWFLIKLSNGITGWIEKKSIGIINPPYFFHVPTVVRKILSIP